MLSHKNLKHDRHAAKYERHRSRSSSEKNKHKRSSQPQATSKDLMRGSTFKSELAKIQNHQPKCFKKEEESFTASASSSFSTPSKPTPNIAETPKLEDVIDSANTISSPGSVLGNTETINQMIICPPPPPPPLPPELLSPPPLPTEESLDLPQSSENSTGQPSKVTETVKTTTSAANESGKDRGSTSKLTSFPMPPPNMILPPSDSEASSDTSGGSVSDSSDSDGDDSSPNSKTFPPKAAETVKSNGSTSGRKSLVEDLPLPKFISE